MNMSTEKKYEIKPRRDRLIYVVAAMIFLLASGYLYWQSIENQHRAAINGAQAATGQDFAAQVLLQCNAEGVSGPLHKAGVCGGAQKVAEQGPVGPAGATGATGPAGPQGLQGPRGFIGPVGPRGPQGKQGVSGNQGVTGSTGASGPQGPQGPAGPAGPAGKDGTNGTDGKDGTSAYPFTFTFTIQQNPAQSQTYTVTCTAAGQPCEVTPV